MSSRTTIRHVSNRAGVSIGTVSNVLNAPHLVSTDTRSRVLDAIAELEYRPSRSARSLQAQRTYLIGYRLPDPGVSSALDIFLHSLVAKAFEYGLEIVLFSPSGGQTDLDAYRKAIRSGDVDGFVLSETNYEDPRIALLTEAGFPFVAFGRALASKPFSWVDVDGTAGMSEVVNHLVGLGHQRIAIVAWPPGSESGDARVGGYLSAMAMAGLPVQPEFMVRADGGFESGREVGRNLLSHPRPPTAIVAVHDDLAFGVMAAAVDQGVKVGPDLAVTGFDDSTAAALSTPGLTSVRQPMELVAATLIESLVSQLRDAEAKKTGTLLVPEVVTRASTLNSAGRQLLVTTWSLIEDRFIPSLVPAHESLFTIGNGYLSTRGTFEESLIGETRASFIQGLFVNPPGELPLLGAVPDWTGLTISIDGTPFNLDRRPAGYKRSVDFRTGVVDREVLWRGPETGVMKLRFRRLLSMADPHLAALEITVAALTTRASVRIETGLDTGIPSPVAPAWSPKRWSRPSPNLIKLVAESIDGAQTLEVEAVLYGAPTDYFIYDHRHHRLVTERQLETGESISYTKYVTFRASRDRDRRSNLPPPETAFDLVAAASRRAWKRRWISSNIEIDGDPAAERALRFAAFQLIGAAAPKDSGAAIGSKMASGFGYRHHVFWDTDIFVLPYFTVTQPDLARSHLAYRYQGLEGARRKAKRYGREGAFYAWESADTGDEVTPEWTSPAQGPPTRIWTGELEEHITSDVAYAAHHYWRWSGDDRFMSDQGVEMVADGARYWASRLEVDSKGAHLSNVIGPDEYHTHVTDSFFTNLSAAWQLRTAASLVEWLRESAPRKASALWARLGLTGETVEAWRQLADNVVLRRDADGIWEQHAGFFDLEPLDLEGFAPRQAGIYDLVGEEQIEKTQVLKQADVVMAMALFPELMGSRQVRRRTWDYYLSRTDHGSSLSLGVHSRVASDLGLRDLSYELFRRGLAIDLEDSMGNGRDGVHAATQGGALQAAIFGFGGLHLAGGRPATKSRLPDHWRSFGFSSFHRGQRHEWELGQAGTPARARSTRT